MSFEANAVESNSDDSVVTPALTVFRSKNSEPAAEVFDGLEIAIEHPKRFTGVSAWATHTPFAMQIVAMLRPRVLVELGTHTGDSYCAFCQAVDARHLPTRCYAVDTWRGDEHSGEYDESIYTDLRQYNEANYNRFSVLIRSTFEKALPYFTDGSIDLLHIDGCHTYDAVRSDFSSWLPKLSDRAVVLFHDTNVLEREFGVRRFWDEITQTYPSSFEFLHGYGLGVLGVGSRLAPEVMKLFNANFHETNRIRQHFSRLGDQVLQTESLRKQLVNSQAMLSQKQNELGQKQDELTQTRGALAEVQRRVDSAAQELADSEQRVAIAQQLHSLSCETAQSLQEQLAAEQAKVEQRIATLNGQAAEVEQDYKQQIAAINGRAADVEQSYNTLRNEAAEKQPQFLAIRQELGVLRVRAVDLQQQLAESQASLSTLQQDVAAEKSRAGQAVLRSQLAVADFEHSRSSFARVMQQSEEALRQERGLRERLVREEWEHRQALDAALSRTREASSQLQNQLDYAHVQLSNYHHRHHDLTAHAGHLNHLLHLAHTEMLADRNSLAWRTVLRFRRLRHAVAPPNTLRGKYAYGLVRMLRVWKRDGSIGLSKKFVKKTLQKLRVLPRPTALNAIPPALATFDPTPSVPEAIPVTPEPVGVAAENIIVHRPVEEFGYSPTTSKAYVPPVYIPPHYRLAGQFSETLPLRSPATAFNPGAIHFAWIIPGPSIGSGGHMNIFRIANWLEKFGHRHTFWIYDPRPGFTETQSREMIVNHFFPLQAEVRHLTHPEEIRGDVLMATNAWSAYPARAATHVRHRFYFVQDYETTFEASGSGSLLTENSYRFGFTCITGGRWLENLMREKYGNRATAFEFAYDPTYYHLDTRVQRAPNRVAFYARALTPRRAVELGLMALDELARRIPNLEVDLFGQDINPGPVQYKYRNLGVLGAQELGRMYREASVGIVLSATNYSIIPNEMMACGLPVVDLAGDNNAAVYPPGVIALAEPSPTGLAGTIERLLTFPELRDNQLLRAFEYLKTIDWEGSARVVERAVVGAVTDTAAAAPTGGNRIFVNPPAPAQPRFHGPILIVGQPEYYRSAYYDLLSDERNVEFPITSADWNVFQHLPAFAKQVRAKTVLVFRPEWFTAQPEAFKALKADGISVIGYSSEPVPHSWNGPQHPDQIQRLRSLLAANRLDYDLIVHFDPSSGELLKSLGFGKLVCYPLPVSRKLFYPEKVTPDLDICFLGRGTDYREQFLMPLKMRYKIAHVAHGLRDEDARELMNRSKVVLNIHNNDYPNFENRVAQALACERPVISQTLSGNILTPWVDYIPFDTPDELLQRTTEFLKNGSETACPTVAKYDLFEMRNFCQAIGLEYDASR
ncbi:rhamnosyltransferase WsaF family glycosyltransferase [Limnoglobus roseus]|uniref:GT2 family glycosyltransferase n=1 Tax=Limnoglobus roseus TaxID=2598579 RepID=A0A5C1AH40_9BACT|nr:class I SAM-dependent methyltransferase [Limnoglobus roseus]QEL17477.1 GT2 family glycosyltransferase [Limnoglobus roseus]